MNWISVIEPQEAARLLHRLTVGPEASANPLGDGAHAPPRPPEHEQATGFWKFVYWLGNFHPAATDLPVGIILAGFLSEILLLMTGKPAFTTITRFCVWAGGIAAFATALLGWCLAGFQFYDNA